MQTPDSSGFTLEIVELGKTIRIYQDVDELRFLKISKQMIIEHLESQRGTLVDTTFRIFEQ